MTARRGKGTLADLGYWVVSVAVALVTALFLILGVGFHPLLSNSMAPEYPVGSVAVTIQTPTNQLREGDVVKLPLPHAVEHDYVHRIVELVPQLGATMVVTQGDNNTSPDPWSLEILSPNTPRVVASIPFVGHLTGFTSSLAAKLFLAFVVVGFVIDALVRFFGRPRRGDRSGRHRIREGDPPSETGEPVSLGIHARDSGIRA